MCVTLTLCVFSKIFFKNFFQNFSNIFFKNFCQNFLLKLRHTASTMASLVPGLGSRKFATQVVYLSLASLGLVAANSRLHASFSFHVRNPNLVRFFQKNFKNFFQNFSNICFKNFCQNIFQNCDTRLLQWYLWSLGLVAANSRLHASFTFYVRNPNLVRFSQNFFQNFFSKFFPIFFFKNFCQNIFPNCDTRLLQWHLWSLGLVAANSRLRLCTCPLRLWAW